MHDDASLPEHMGLRLRRALAPDERVRWSAVPQPDAKNPYAATSSILFAVLWTGFMCSNFRVPQNLNGGVALWLAVLVTGVLLIRRPNRIRRRILQGAANTLYAITDRRAIIFNGGFYGSPGTHADILVQLNGDEIQTRSFAPGSLTSTHCIEFANGCGDIVFDHSEYAHELDGRKVEVRSGFYSIPEVRHVEQLLHELVATFDTGNAP